MAELERPLVLASASPRRKELLETARVPFAVVPSNVDETQRPDEEARVYVARAARDKAAQVAGSLHGGDVSVVLGADTVVVVDGVVLGKPTDDAQARGMIERLGGRVHDVITAVALCEVGGVLGEIAVLTRVRFRALAPEEAARYVATGEGRDKAGSYAVQGIGAGLVEAIEGSYTNVVGLPLVETLSLLREHGVLRTWP